MPLATKKYYRVINYHYNCLLLVTYYDSYFGTYDGKSITVVPLKKQKLLDGYSQITAAFDWPCFFVPCFFYLRCFCLAYNLHTHQNMCNPNLACV